MDTARTIDGDQLALALIRSTYPVAPTPPPDTPEQWDAQWDSAIESANRAILTAQDATSQAGYVRGEHASVVRVTTYSN